MSLSNPSRDQNQNLEKINVDDNRIKYDRINRNGVGERSRLKTTRNTNI